MSTFRSEQLRQPLNITGSLTVSGSIFALQGLTSASQQWVVTYNTASGQLYYTASSAIGGGSTINNYYNTSSYIATGSVTASVNVTTSSMFQITSGSTNAVLFKIARETPFTGVNYTTDQSLSILTPGAGRIGTTSGNSLILMSSNVDRWYLNSSGHFTPNTVANNTYDIGSAAAQVRNLYIGTSAIITGSLNVTGSVIFRGNQTVYGDVIVGRKPDSQCGVIQIAIPNKTNTIGYNDIQIVDSSERFTYISPSEVSTYYQAGLHNYGSSIASNYIYSYSQSNEIDFAMNAKELVGGNVIHSGPAYVMYVSNSIDDFGYKSLIEFENYDNYTDGRVTFKTPVKAETGITGAIYNTNYKSNVSSLRMPTYAQSQTEQSGGLLIPGMVYQNGESYDPVDDFSNVAEIVNGSLNRDGFIFRATGRKPIRWTNGTTLMPMYAPYVTKELENTFGFTPYWRRSDTGSYYFESAEINRDTLTVYPTYITARHTIWFYPVQSVFPYDWRSNIYAPNNIVQTILCHSSGFIFIGGYFTSGSGTPLTTPTNYIAKMDSNGGFSSLSIKPLNGIVQTLVETSDGSILVGGDFTGGIKKIDINGNEDPDFIASTNSGVQSIALQSDGKIIIGGYFTVVFVSDITEFNINKLARLHPNGDVDTTFNSGGASISGLNNAVKVVAVDYDDKILVGGSFITYNGSRARCFVKLNVDGSYDHVFMNKLLSVSYGMYNSTVSSMAIHKDGYIVGGIFTSYGVGPIGSGSQARAHINRINRDGTEDKDFYYGIGGVNGLGVNNEVKAITVQKDGNILIGGSFTNIDNSGVGYNRIARLKPTGEIDKNFYEDVTPGFNDAVTAIAQSIDGNDTYVGGWFTTFKDLATRRVAKMRNTNRVYLYTQFDGVLSDSVFIDSDGIVIDIKDYTPLI